MGLSPFYDDHGEDDIEYEPPTDADRAWQLGEDDSDRRFEAGEYDE